MNQFDRNSFGETTRGWRPLALVALVLFGGCGPENGGAEKHAARPAPVRVAPVVQTSIELRRVFSGSLQAKAEFVVAPKIGGRIESLEVDVADPVSRGGVVARLSDAEYEQAEASAEAEKAVADANLTQARNALEIAKKALERVKTLRSSGVSSESQLDTANANYLSAESQVAIAESELVRARADLEAARIRRRYTQVRADWSDRFGDGSRVVAERYVNEGDTVSPGAEMFLVVELDPIMGVFFVTERDYVRLQSGQAVTLRTDALPGRSFSGAVSRVAPIFDESSRQARIEIDIRNQDGVLKPGMFARAEVVLDRVESATVVPVEALCERDHTLGVFLLSNEGNSVRWTPVEVGLRNAKSAEILSPEFSGHVVTLGHNLVDDGSPVSLPEGLPGQS